MIAVAEMPLSSVRPVQDNQLQTRPAPDVSNLLPYSNNGASPAVGQPLGLISAGPASYFDGTTALYMLPTVNANMKTSVSLSV